MKPAVSVNDVTKRYGEVEALKSATFSVNPGELFGIIGPDGAGKSTLFRILTTLLLADSGTATVNGLDVVKDYKQIRQQVGYMPGRFSLYQDLSVEENLEMGAFTRPSSEFDDGIADVYQRFPRLKERRRQVAGTLSGGEQQMLAMGRALMSKPRLLMLDEPSMGLAPILVEQIFDIIQELNQHGTTILLVEQNAQMALSVAHRGYVLETGKIVTTGSGEELLEDEAVKKAYLGG